MDVDDAGEHARLSVHIEGFSFPRVRSSAGVDGVIARSPTGCSIDCWVRPSTLSRVANIVTGLLYLGLAFVMLRAAFMSVAKGEVGGILGGAAFTAAFLGIGIATIRAQRRLAASLVDALEEAAASTALTPPIGSDLPPAPRRVMTSRERAVHEANTRVRIGEPSSSAGCLRTTTGRQRGPAGPRIRRRARIVRLVSLNRTLSAGSLVSRIPRRID